MMRTMWVMTAGAVLWATPAAAQGSAATCKLRIETNAATWVIQGYDPFGSTPPIGTFDVVLTNDGDGPCEVYPTFSLLSEAYGLKNADTGQAAQYSLYDLSGGYDATPISGITVARGTRRRVEIAPRGQQINRYRFAVSDDSLRADGLYSQRVQLEARTAAGDTLAARQFTVGVNVAPTAVLSLSGAFRRVGGRAVVDLGKLSTGVTTMPLQLRVQSTRRYTVSFSSKNAGELRYGSTNWAIPYAIVVGSRTVSLTGEGKVTETVQSRDDIQTMPVQFAIGDVSAKRAGVYSDVLTISVGVD